MDHYPESMISALQERARQLRLDSIDMIYRRGAGHPGGALSAAEIITALFFEKLRLDPQWPGWPERDRFILSKGHASAILYAALARRGFFPMEDLKRWGELDCQLQGHPDRLKTPGVEMSSGILGHGVAIGVGLAMSARLNGQGFRTYVLLGDGECQAGVVWEGAMDPAKFRLANLTVIVDNNNVQLDGAVHEIMLIEPLAGKWRACNWSVLEINGHNMRQILESVDMAAQIHDRPTAIIARTTKGKGISFMENQAQWHGIPPDDEQYAQAVAELNGRVV